MNFDEILLKRWYTTQGPTIRFWRTAWWAWLVAIQRVFGSRSVHRRRIMFHCPTWVN